MLDSFPYKHNLIKCKWGETALFYNYVHKSFSENGAISEPFASFGKITIELYKKSDPPPG